MSLLFSLRGDSLTPRYAMGGKEYTLFLEGGSLNNPPAPVAVSDPSCFGGYALDVGNASNYRQILYPTKRNWVRNTKVFSMRFRAAPAVSGTPASDVSPVRIGQLNQATTYGGCRLVWQDNNLLRIQAQPKQSLGDLFLSASASISLVSDSFKDYMLTSDGTNWYCSIEGVQVATGSVSNPANAAYDLDWLTASMIIVGQYPFRGKLNELTLWDSCEPHVYSPRTSWLDCPDFDGSSYSDPGEAHVEKDVSYIFAGASKVGTYEPAMPETVDPGEANVREGQAYKISGVDKEGTAAIPAASDVREGVAVDDTVGTCAVPDPSNVTRDIPVDDTVGTRDTVTNEVGGAVAVGEDNEGTASFNEGSF